MKRIFMLTMMAVFLLSSVVAYDSQFMPDSEIGVPETGVTEVEYCVWDTTAHVVPIVGMPIYMGDVCHDQDGFYGCQAGDLPAGSDFVVTLDESETQADGCVGVTITTDEAEGHYYFTLEGEAGAEGQMTVVTSETAHALVPEFGTVAMVGLLGVAGLFIYKRRE